MAEYVQSGEKLLASQYNALVDALAGPTNATTDQPFTQTKNGIVVNGGIGRQTTKAASTVPVIFEVSYGNGYVGAGYSTYQEGDVDANRFNGVFLNVGSTWEEAAYNGFVLGNGVALPTIPILVIIDPTSDNAAVVIHNRALANTITKGKLPLCTADKDAGYAFVQVVDNGEAGKSYNGDFVLLVGDFTKIGGTSGSDIRTVIFNNLRATIRGISIYENCEDVRVVQSGVLWKNIVATDVIGANVPHLSYTVGTQYVAMLPDSYVDRNNADGEHVWSNALMDLKLKSIGVVPRQQMGFAELRPTNTFELYNFDKLSSDIESLSEIDEGELSSYDVLLKHKRPHPYAEDDSLYEGQAEADLQYISLSALLEGYVGDSQLPDLNLSSVVVRKDDGQNFIELHEFHEDNAKSVSDISGDGVDLLIRNPKGGGRELQYLSLSSLSAALSGSSTVDSETDLQLSSIQRNQDNGSLELFDFDDSDTEDFGQLSDSGNYDVVLRKYSGDRELPAQVDYLQLSTLTNALDVKTDTAKTNQQYQSLEEHTQDGERYFGLYDFQTPGYSRTLKVNLSYGATTYVVQSGSGTGSPDPKVQFITRDASGNPFVSYDNIAVTAPRISASDVDGIESIISGDVTVISTELSVLSGDISDLSSQLSNYWKVGGTYDDNCYGQSIGDASKTQAIGLNSRELYAKDGSTALHWNRRVAYDGNGNPAINWSDGVYGSRCLIHRQGMPTVDWLNMALMGRVNGTTVAWEDRSLKGAWTVDQGTNPGGAASLTVNGQLATTSTLKIGNTTLNETQLQQLLALLNP